MQLKVPNADMRHTRLIFVYLKVVDADEPTRCCFQSTYNVALAVTPTKLTNVATVVQTAENDSRLDVVWSLDIEAGLHAQLASLKQTAAKWATEGDQEAASIMHRLLRGVG